MDTNITAIAPAIALFFITSSVNIKINNMLKKSPLNAINKNIFKLPLLEVKTNIELRKQETKNAIEKPIIVARIGEIRLARYK